MKVFKLMFAGVLAIALVAGISIASDEAPWLDMENCAMCKNLMAEEGLLEHMTYTSHKIATGMINIATVEPEWAAKYAKANEGMAAVQAKLVKGEKVDLCACCNDIGALMMAGAKMDNVQMANGDAMVVTATNPELIAKIHAHSQKTTDFMAEMAKMEQGQ